MLAALEKDLSDKGLIFGVTQSTLFRPLNWPGTLLQHVFCITDAPTWNADQLTAVCTPSKPGSGSLHICQRRHCLHSAFRNNG